VLGAVERHGEGDDAIHGGSSGSVDPPPAAGVCRGRSRGCSLRQTTWGRFGGSATPRQTSIPACLSRPLT